MTGLVRRWPHAGHSAARAARGVHRHGQHGQPISMPIRAATDIQPTFVAYLYTKARAPGHWPCWSLPSNGAGLRVGSDRHREAATRPRADLAPTGPQPVAPRPAALAAREAAGMVASRPSRAWPATCLWPSHGTGVQGHSGGSRLDRLEAIETTALSPALFVARSGFGRPLGPAAGRQRRPAPQGTAPAAGPQRRQPMAPQRAALTLPASCDRRALNRINPPRGVHG